MKGALAARIAFWGGIASGLVAAGAAYGSGFGLWHFTVGFLGVAAGMVLALIATIAGVGALIRRPPGTGRAVIGLLVAGGLIAVMGYWIDRGRKAPMIHDVTTDLASPPQFETIPPRKDNLAGLKGGEAEWRRLHAAAYGDVRPVVLPVPPAEAMTRVQRLVAQRGWEVASVTGGRLEATATDSPFAFKDDVVIVLTPEDKGTRIDMRSVSRVGLSDLGVNAERVRAFLREVATP